MKKKDNQPLLYDIVYDIFFNIRKDGKLEAIKRIWFAGYPRILSDSRSSKYAKTSSKTLH